MFNFGNKQFTSFSQAKQHLKSLLKSEDRFLNQEEFNIVFDYLDYHPSASEKKRFTIDKIKIEYPPNHKYKTHKCFVLYYENGIKEEFSYLKCNKNKTNNIECLYKKAYRDAIKEQVVSYKKSSKENKCAICNQQVDTLQVDHKTISFSKLIKQFEDKQKSLQKPNIVDSVNAMTRIEFENKELKYVREWQKFHDIKADYQLLCSKCNQKKGSK